MTIAVELGQYWVEVALSYVLAVLLLSLVTALSLYESHRTRKKLRELECAPDERKPSPLLVLPVAVFAATAALFLAGLQRSDEGGMQSSLIGRAAPAMNLRPLGNGPPPDRSDISDDHVKLVNFWASWCAPCRVEHPSLQALSDQGIAILGVNYKDAPDNALGFLAELGNPFHKIGADSEGRTAIDWGVYGVPETFVVDAAGIVRLRWAGPITGRILNEQIIPAISEARLD